MILIMTSFLNAVSNAGSGLGQAANAVGNAIGTLSSIISPNASSNTLPSSSIPYLQPGISQRQIINWFVPEVGIVNMYINPQGINYQEKKLIQSIRTKGGYTIQYWGEELQVLGIRGNTGSSGVEGLQVLEQIYRAEQLVFDPLALTMIANSSLAGLNGLVNSTLGLLGSIGTTLSNATQGVMSIDPLSQNILPQNIPTLASLALGVEMYYSGRVYRGYFTSFSYTESTQQLGLFEYDIQFMVTQVRGYRTNQFAWQRSAIAGPSNNSPGGVPLSFQGLTSG
jgi:hypothetical protein